MNNAESCLILLCSLFAACRPCGGSDPLVMENANNYTFLGTMEITSLPLAEATDATITWDTLSTDFQGHPVDPSADIQSAQLVDFRYLSQEEVQEGLTNDDIDQVDVGLFASAPTEGATSVNLSDLQILSYPFVPKEHFQSAFGTWLFILSKGTVPGQGAAMTAFLQPDPKSKVTTAAITNGSTELTVDVDLQSLSPVSMPIETPEVVVDWSGLTKDRRGNTLDAGLIDQVMVGRFDSLELPDLEASFLDLELLMDAVWYGSTTGEPQIALSGLSGEEGDFPGIDMDALWLLALRCSTCANPAPLVLTVLEGCK